jgi:hypothetical protein
MSNSSHPPLRPTVLTDEHKARLVMAACETLQQLLKVRDLAFAHGRGESWTALYTQGYLLKLRVMR